MIITTTASGRVCRQAITALLKAELATEVKRIQYVKSYTLASDKKGINKQEEKVLLITLIPGKEEKAETILKKILKDGFQKITHLPL